MAVLRGPTSRPAREARPALAIEPVERPANLALRVVDDGFAVRRLVTGEPERVQRERIDVGRRPLLLDQAAEDTNLDGVCIHPGKRNLGALEAASPRPRALRVRPSRAARSSPCSS